MLTLGLEPRTRVRADFKSTVFTISPSEQSTYLLVKKLIFISQTIEKSFSSFSVQSLQVLLHQLGAHLKRKKSYET